MAAIRKLPSTALEEVEASFRASEKFRKNSCPKCEGMQGWHNKAKIWIDCPKCRGTGKQKTL